jgi:hypothetical protein
MNSAADDAFSRWCAERPAPREINAWLARCPEPTMMLRQPQPEQSDDSYKRLRQEVETLRREVRELSATLEAVRAETWKHLSEICDETGKITGSLGREIDQLRKRVEAAR